MSSGTCCDASSRVIRKDLTLSNLCAAKGTICDLRSQRITTNELIISGDGAVLGTEYAYFHSDTIFSTDMTIDFPGTNLQVLQPDLPSTFLMFNLSSNNTPNITSSGANLQFIDTVDAGAYEFAISFSLENTSTATQDPETTLVLGTSTLSPYIDANTGFFSVITQFEPSTIATDMENQLYFVNMHGVVDLPANASTAILIAPGTSDVEYDFGTYNVTVKRLT